MKKKSLKDLQLDPWEQEISDAIENGEFVDAPNVEKEKEYIKILAESTLKRRKSINIRISEQDLFRIKSKALAEGLPYQTYISSILHKHVKA